MQWWQAGWMADVTDSACDTCAAGVVFGTSLEPHGRLTPLFHTPHGRAHAADRERKGGLVASTDGRRSPFVTTQSEIGAESRIPNFLVPVSLEWFRGL